MWALIDCNSFFCSVEKVFHPGLNGKPVCVLSSNDGNIVALTPEAKALGLHRGDPVFKVKSILEANKVNIFSSNLMLYAAMSRRILSILRKEIMQVENYSIDESFCNLHGYEKMGPLDCFMRNIVEKIRLYTDIPVSVGIAPSKTLAKMGSKYAKQYAGYRSVCLIERFMMPSTSSCVSDREKGAFFLRLSSLKKDFCCACICSLTASSAYLCIRESMVVYIFRPS